MDVSFVASALNLLATLFIFVVGLVLLTTVVQRLQGFLKPKAHKQIIEYTLQRCRCSVSSSRGRQRLF